MRKGPRLKGLSRRSRRRRQILNDGDEKRHVQRWKNSYVTMIDVKVSIKNKDFFNFVCVLKFGSKRHKINERKM